MSISGLNSCRENSALLIEQSRCLSHLSYVFHSLDQNNKSLMAALQELNAAEEAEENLHEVTLINRHIQKERNKNARVLFLVPNRKQLPPKQQFCMPLLLFVSLEIG